MNTEKKRVVVSAGPIPARLDSVKFLTNKFKGGLAFKTAAHLAMCGHQVTVVHWLHTPVPDIIRDSPVPIEAVKVTDVYDYVEWFRAHALHYDAFVMAAAVANLAPVHPYGGKFPSHKYNVGDEFDIRFCIAPRAIDEIKKINPRACVIGYKLFDAPSDESLVDIARHTLRDSRANIIFANTPSEARVRKLALTQDGSVIPCSFTEHLELMDRAIHQEYYKTVIEPLSQKNMESRNVKEALATVKMFEKTFESTGYGTVAVPIRDMPGAFATTARGHKRGPVIVTNVDHETRTVTATGKATLNAPALAAVLPEDGRFIVVHRHDDDPLYNDDAPKSAAIGKYLFPGTAEEVREMSRLFSDPSLRCAKQPHHGYLKLAPILPVDWTRYQELFPAKYFGVPDAMESVISEYAHSVTLEIGGGATADAKYGYDPYVKPDKTENLTWLELVTRRFSIGYARNSINYLRKAEIETILNHCEKFIANTFRAAPDEKITENEAAVKYSDSEGQPKIAHALRLPDDSVMYHDFFAYSEKDWESLGLTLTRYGNSSALLTKGLPDLTSALPPSTEKNSL